MKVKGINISTGLLTYKIQFMRSKNWFLKIYIVYELTEKIFRK